MIAFGGGAPLHAARLAEKLGMARVLVPVDASVGSAVGFLRAPIAFEIARSFAQREDDFDAAAINRLLDAMRAEASAIVAAGAPGEALEAHRSVEMRHLGQGHELAVPLPDRSLSGTDCATLRESYQARYEEQFGVRIADVPVEFLTWQVTVTTTASGSLAEPAPGAKGHSAAHGSRTVFDPASGKAEAIPAFRRSDLAAGTRFSGPALVIEPQTTTLVPAGWDLEVASTGHLLLARR